MIEVLALHFLLIGFAMVEVIEVADNNRHWQCNCQHTGNGAQRADNLAPHSDRPIVAVGFANGRSWIDCEEYNGRN